MSLEQWRKVASHKRYSVSSSGRVRNDLTGKILSPRKSHGYLHVRLYSTSGSKEFRVHRLVGKYFLANPKNKKEINHKNGEKTANRAKNIEWATSSENKKHAFATGLNVFPVGSKHFNSKLTENDIVKIRDMAKKGIFQKDIASRFRVNKGTISLICLRKTWAHVS